MENELKPFWRKLFDFDWKFGVFLIIIICVPRFILVLNANETANYSYIGVIMAMSAIAPFVFLSRFGRKTVGLTKPRNVSWLFFGFAFGALLAFFFICWVSYCSGIRLKIGMYILENHTIFQ